MIKKFAAIGVMALTLTTCSTPSEAVEIKPIVTKVINPEPLFKLESFYTKIKLQANETKMNKAVSNLKKYVGKTWYVFAGSTPNGWDCSGLTLWTYKQLGIELHHGASAQKNYSKPHKYSQAKAKVGDIIAFGWSGYSGAGHVGIYIGNGKMIHVPAPGYRTMVQTVKSFGRGYSKVTYTRLIKTS